MTTENPSAFPIPALTLSNGVGYPTHPGMTLRDWFAGQALAGMLANSHADYSPLAPQSPENFAGDAYRLADAMLAERARGQGDD